MSRLLIPYVTATWPNIDQCCTILDLYDRYGDIIEIGVPTDNPKYDGPTIKITHAEAQSRGVEAVLTQLSKFKPRHQVMILAYYEDFRNRLDKFFELLSQIENIRTVLFPDLLFDFYDEIEHYVDTCRKFGLEPSFFISTKFPYTVAQRLLKYRPMLVYLGAQVATGVELPIYVERNVRIFRQILHDVTLVVGFAISRKSQVEKLMQLNVDGVVIGTELIKRFKTGGVESVEEFLREVKSVLANT